MPAARSPGLKVRTPAFQAGGIGFKSHGDHHISTSNKLSKRVAEGPYKSGIFPTLLLSNK